MLSVSVPSVRWPGWRWVDDGICPEYDVSVPKALTEQQQTSDTAWHVLVETLPLYLSSHLSQKERGKGMKKVKRYEIRVNCAQAL